MVKGPSSRSDLGIHCFFPKKKMLGVLFFKTLKDFARKTAKLQLGSQSSCSLQATGPNGEEMWLGGLE